MKLKRLKVNDILIPERLRKTVDPDDLDKLQADLVRSGQIHPIRVRPLDEHERKEFPDLSWALVVGFRRLTATIRLALAGATHSGLELGEIYGVDYSELSPFERKRIELHENLFREEMDPLEVVAARAQLHELFVSEFPEWTADDSAREMGISAGNLSKDLKLNAAIKEDPTLAQANSKRAAVRHMELRESLRHREIANEQTRSQIGTLRSKLHRGDARDWIRNIPTHSVDLAFSDFPYGIGYDTRMDASGGTKGGVAEFDDSPEAARDLVVDLVPQYLRVVRPTGWLALMIGPQYEFLLDLVESCCVTHFEYGRISYTENETGEWIRHMPDHCEGLNDWNTCRFVRAERPRWIWYRPNSNFRAPFPDRHAQSMYEEIMVVNMGTGRLYVERGNVLVHDAEYGSERIHSHQKPLSLCVDVIERLTTPGDVVLDAVCGSGNHLRAASRLARDIRGCEKNVNIFESMVANVALDFTGPVTPREHIEVEETWVPTTSA